MSDNPWDDEAFKKRVRAAVKKKGITLRAALDAAGVSRYHLDKSGHGRSTSTVFRLARVLDVSPAHLFGLTDASSAACVSLADVESKTIEPEKLVRISLYTKVIAAQLATLIFMESDHSEVEPKALREFVLRVINQIAGDLDHGSA